MITMDAILVVNAGSSSLKFQVFGTKAAGALECLVKGQVDGVGTRPRLRAEGPDKTSLIDETYAPEKVPDLPAAIQVAGDWLRRTQKVNLIAVGHRVVHGGPDYDRPVRVTDDVVRHQRHQRIRATGAAVGAGAAVVVLDRQGASFAGGQGPAGVGFAQGSPAAAEDQRGDVGVAPPAFEQAPRQGAAGAAL